VWCCWMVGEARWLAWVGGLLWAAAGGGGISAGGCLAGGEDWGGRVGGWAAVLWQGLSG